MYSRVPLRTKTEMTKHVISGSAETLVRAWEFVLLNSSQLMLILWFLGPHSEDTATEHSTHIFQHSFRPPVDALVRLAQGLKQKKSIFPTGINENKLKQFLCVLTKLLFTGLPAQPLLSWNWDWSRLFWRWRGSRNLVKSISHYLRYWLHEY